MRQVREHKYRDIDPVKQFREWMKNTLRRAFFRYWERTKAIQTARVDRGLYQCAGCKVVSKIQGMHIDHILPVVDPAVGFSGWDVYIARLFCSASNLQLLCKECHTTKTKTEQLARKAAKIGIFAIGRIMPEEQKQKIVESLQGRMPPVTSLEQLRPMPRRIVIGTKITTNEIVEFPSLTDASSVTGASVGNIASICGGKTKRTQSKGWRFAYREKEKC